MDQAATIPAVDTHPIAEVRPHAVDPAPREMLASLAKRFAPAQQPSYRYSLDVKGGPHDFDFIDGEWSSTQLRLRQRGVGSTDWEPFSGRHWAKVLLGGIANVDTVDFPEKGWSGMTVRHFDKAKQQWTIYWINSRDGRMDVPGQVGGFDGDVGLFYGDDVDEGKPVRVVYRWEKVSPGHARWEQAFSYDGGKTWETNWKMELTRLPR